MQNNILIYAGKKHDIRLNGITIKTVGNFSEAFDYILWIYQNSPCKDVTVGKKQKDIKTFIDEYFVLEQETEVKQ